jgi:peptidoglycan/LPS O-acetylase OafA/YrhL
MTADHFIWLSTALLALSLPAARSLFIFRPIPTPPQGAPPAHEDGRTTRLISVDATRAMAIIGVVGIHAFYLAAASPGMLAVQWIPAAFVNNMARFAVPVFLFFSGFYLTPPHRGLSGMAGFYVKKLRTVILPYALVSSALVLHGRGELIALASSMDSSDWSVLMSFSLDASSLKEVARALLTGSASLPFYFIVVLVQMYAIYPLLRPLLKMYPSSSLFAILILSYLTVYPFPKPDVVGVPFFLPYLFPFALGVALSSHRLRPEPTPALWAIWLLYFALNSLAAVILILTGGTAFPADSWYTYNFQYFFAVSTAIICGNWFSQHPRLTAMLAPLGRYSLWIFLLHYPIQSLIWSKINLTDPGMSLLSAMGLWAGCVLLFWIPCSLLARWHNQHPKPA